VERIDPPPTIDYARPSTLTRRPSGHWCRLLFIIVSVAVCLYFWYSASQMATYARKFKLYNKEQVIAATYIDAEAQRSMTIAVDVIVAIVSGWLVYGAYRWLAFRPEASRRDESGSA
jgi:hypothetical protein